MTNKDILKQYVNTGTCISKYQVNKLNNNLLNSYLRARIINYKNLIKPLDKLPDEQFDYRDIRVFEYDKMNDKHIQMFIDVGLYVMREILQDHENLIEAYLLSRVNHFPKTLHDWEVSLIMKKDNIRCVYITSGVSIYDYNMLSENEKYIYLQNLVDKNEKIDDNYDIKRLLSFPDLFKKYCSKIFVVGSVNCESDINNGINICCDVIIDDVIDDVVTEEDEVEEEEEVEGPPIISLNQPEI